MVKLEVDLGDDRVDVHYDPKRLSPERMLEAVRALGYDPAVVGRPSVPAREAQERIDPALLTQELKGLLVESRDRGRFLLLDFTGPG